MVHLNTRIGWILTTAIAVGVCGWTEARAQVPGRRAAPVAEKPAVLPPVVRLALRAARTLRYSGTRTVEFVVGADRRRHVEYVLKDGPRSRVWFPAKSPNAGQIIVEKGGRRLHYFPGREVVEDSAARGEDAYVRFVQALKNRPRRRITEMDGGTIAGVLTREVDVADAAGNVVQRLWIDPATGMVLRRDLFDAVGARLGYFEFQKINYNPVIRPEDFQINRQGVRFTKLRDRLVEQSKLAGVPAFTIVAKKGYNLTAVRVLNAGGRAPILVQTFRGAKGAVTLFQTKSPIDGKRLQRLAGRLQTYTWEKGGGHFALVGDTDVAELQRVAALVGRL